MVSSVPYKSNSSRTPKTRTCASVIESTQTQKPDAQSLLHNNNNTKNVYNTQPDPLKPVFHLNVGHFCDRASHRKARFMQRVYNQLEFHFIRRSTAGALLPAGGITSLINSMQCLIILSECNLIDWCWLCVDASIENQTIDFNLVTLNSGEHVSTSKMHGFGLNKLY